MLLPMPPYWNKCRGKPEFLAGSFEKWTRHERGTLPRLCSNGLKPNIRSISHVTMNARGFRESQNEKEAWGDGGGGGAIPRVLSVYAPYIPSSQVSHFVLSHLPISLFLLYFPPMGKPTKLIFIWIRMTVCTVLFQIKTTLQCYLSHLADLSHGRIWRI